MALTAFVVLLLLPQSLLAQTQTVDFEGFTGPSGFTSAEPPLTIGIAKFSGGQRLTATFNLADRTTVYGTAFFCTNCLPTLTIDFSEPVSNVSLKVLNGQTFVVTYTVQDNAGGTPQVFALQSNGDSGQTTVTLPSTGITQVTVTSNAGEAWDFFIDDVQFTEGAGPVINTVASGLNFPFGVAVDNGNVYIADRNNHKVWKLGEGLTLVAGTGEAGYNGDGISATTAQLNSPTGVAVSNGNLLIADSGSHIIRKVVLSSGIITTVAGIPQKNGLAENGGLATAATLFGPRGVATDAAGNIYIADTMNQQIRKVNASTGLISAVAGVAGETGSNDGSVATARLNSPLGVAVNAAGTLVYIADEGNDLIRVVNADGVGTVDANDEVDPLDSPSGVAVAGNGNLYIADTDNHRIRLVTPEGTTTVAGTGAPGFSGDNGPATAAQLNTPVAVAVDSTGEFLYIADLINNKIRIVDFGGFD
jgi:sugar lactone lactonase YvrE